MIYRGSQIMRFHEGICINCKHELQLDTTKKTSTCPFCGVNYDVVKTINNKETLLEEKRQLELNESKNKKIENKTDNTDDIKGPPFIIFIVIAMVALGVMCLMLHFLYPEQHENFQNSTNTEAVIDEETMDEIDSVTDKNEQDAIEPSGDQLVKEELGAEDDESMMETQLSNEDFKLGENTMNRETRLLLDRIISIMKVMFSINLFIGLIRLILARLHDDFESASCATGFMILSVFLLMISSAITLLYK